MLLPHTYVLICAKSCTRFAGELYGKNIIGRNEAFKYALKCYSVINHELNHSAQHPFFSSDHRDCYAELTETDAGHYIFTPNENFSLLIMVIGIGQYELNYTPADRDTAPEEMWKIEQYFRRQIFKIKFIDQEDLLRKFNKVVAKTKNKFGLGSRSDDFAS